MAAKGRIGKAEEAARAAQQNQFVQRLIEDQDVRASLLTAYGAARGAVDRLSDGKPASEVLLEDKKLHGELKEAAGALIDATKGLREPAKSSRRKGGLGRTLLLLGVGAALALALSDGLRSTVLDKLFGAEEEFDYSSTTTPAEPAPAGVAG